MVPTGCRCRRGKISLAPVNGSGATGWLLQTLEQPGKTLAAALRRTALLGPQDYLPPNPKRAGPTFPASWDTNIWRPDAADAEDYANAQAASDAAATPVVRRLIGTPMSIRMVLAPSPACLWTMCS